MGYRSCPRWQSHCGRRFRVQVRAEWTCMFPFERNHRRLEDAVVLQRLRCDGAFHGGCQLGCMMFWKEAWLRQVDGPACEEARPVTDEPQPQFATRRREDASLYRCQGTEIARATTPGPPLWHPAQYIRMLRVRTFNAREFIAMFAGVARRKLDRLLRRFEPQPAAANAPRPPDAPLGLRPGELVSVKSKDAIRATLDAEGNAPRPRLRRDDVRVLWQEDEGRRARRAHHRRADRKAPAVSHRAPCCSRVPSAIVIAAARATCR